MNFKKEHCLNESAPLVKKQFNNVTELITPGRNAILAFVNRCNEVSESMLSNFIYGINDKHITTIDWVNEKGTFFVMNKKNNQFFYSLSELGKQVLQESSNTENIDLIIIGEGRMAVVKRKYKQKPAITIQEKTKVRNKVLSFVDENGSVTKTAFITFLKQMNEEIGSLTSFRWVKRNAQFFKVSKDKTTNEEIFTISSLGKRVLLRTVVNENITVEEILNEDYAEKIILMIADQTKVNIEQYDINQLKIGMEVEMINAGPTCSTIGNDPTAAFQLVIRNLKTDNKYYTTAKPEIWGNEFFNHHITKESDDIPNDIIDGGKGDNMSAMDIAKKHNVSKDIIDRELAVGKFVELEHTHDELEADEIARDHLTEDPHHYSKLINAGLVDEPDAIALAKKILDINIYNHAYENNKLKNINDNLKKNTTLIIDEKKDDIPKNITQDIIDIALQFSDIDGILIAANKKWTNLKSLIDYLKDFIKPRDTKAFINNIHMYIKQNKISLDESGDTIHTVPGIDNVKLPNIDVVGSGDVFGNIIHTKKSLDKKHKIEQVNKDILLDDFIQNSLQETITK